MIQHSIHVWAIAQHTIQNVLHSSPLQCNALHHQGLHYGLQEADEASVIADAKARLPAEPAKADPSACRIGRYHFLGCFLWFGLHLLLWLHCLNSIKPCPLPLGQA